MDQDSELNKLELRIVELENELKALKAEPPAQDLTAEEIIAYRKVRDTLRLGIGANQFPDSSLYTYAAAQQLRACGCANRPPALSNYADASAQQLRACGCANRPPALSNYDDVSAQQLRACGCANRPPSLSNYADAPAQPPNSGPGRGGASMDNEGSSRFGDLGN